MNDKKKRSGKTTRQQYAIYLEELENNISFRINKYEPNMPDILDKSWAKIVLQLNSSGGPSRTMSQWKRIFSDWKSQVRKRARIIKLSQKTTGGGQPEKPLTDLEEKLLELTGFVVINGIPGVEELGVPVSETEIHENNETTSEEQLPFSLVKMKTSEQKNDSRSSEEQPSILTDTPRKKQKTENKSKTVSSSVEALLNSETTVLKEINFNLKQLVKLKRKELTLTELKLKLKYGVDLEYESNNSDL